MKKWWQGWRCPVIGCILLSSQVFAQTSTFPPGEYLTEEGWGILNIKPAQQGRQKFDLTALGANGHACDLDGEIYQGKATLIEEDSKSPCDISFEAKGTHIDVRAISEEDCRRYCGVRAHFEAVYLKPAPGCDTASRVQTRKAFKKLYDRKDYAAAERTLAPLLTDCKKNLHWQEDGWIRNDLALTQAKLGKGAACKATLKPVLEGTEESDEDVCTRADGAYPRPADCDPYLSIVQAARVNLKWCAKAKNGPVK